MQSNPESFSWYLKNLREQKSSILTPEIELEIGLLRMIKLFGPIPVEKFVEICKSDSNLPFSRVFELLERLDKNDEITIKADDAFGGQKAVEITQKGLIRLEIGGSS